MRPIVLARWTASGLATIAIGLLSFGAFASHTARAAQPAPQAPATFSTDVAPILFDRCGACHRPDGAAPFSLLTYSSAKQHAGQMLTAVRSRFMPPWKAEPGYGDFIGQQHLTSAEIGVLERWVASGTPEGDPQQLPVRQWPEGWQLGTPDVVVSLPAPFALQADGTDVSRVFVLPVPVRTMRYVKGLEFRPGNPKVVHHANIRLDRTAASRELDAQDPRPGYDGLILRSAVFPDGHFLGWTPGQIAPLLPKGLAWRLDPGADLVVEIHMQPSGKPETVAPSIGLYFTDEAPERTPVMLRLGRQNIDIAEGDANYVVTDAFVLPVDVEVQAVQPHAHSRARDVRGTATLPDGTTRPLIVISNWDFRWQHVYRFVKPLSLPKGTTVAMRYTFDNSANNPRNPQLPPARVSWGQFSRDEMGDLWIQVLTRDDADRRTLTAAFRPKLISEDVAGYETMIRRDGAKVALHDDVAVLYLELGRTAEAAAHFEASARLAPESAAAHYNLATTLMLLGRVEEAIDRFRRALALRPGYALAHNNLGDAFVRLGRLDQAEEEFREAVRLEPGYADAYYNRASVLRTRGRIREAEDALRRAVELKPDLGPALAGLAWLLATANDPALRNPVEAIRLGERAVNLTGSKDVEALDALAAALAAAGRFDRAADIAAAALALGLPEAVTAAIRERRQLYLEGKSFISP